MSQRYWDAHARTDPMWAVLTDPAKAGGRWDPEEFFAIGVTDVTYLLSRCQALNRPASRRTALDFGCGLGRLTQPLADHFDKVYGVDVSTVMLEQARKYNRKGERCEFVWNGGPRLKRFADDSIDLIYTKLVLQHIPPRQVRAYLREFLRILAPGGLLYFQLPGRAIRARPGIAGEIGLRMLRLATRLHLHHGMYMNGMPRERVIAFLQRHGGTVLAVDENGDAGVDYESFAYAVTR